MYVRCLYGDLGREIIKYTAIYGVNIWFWPTLRIYGPHRRIIRNVRRIYTVLANPKNARLVNLDARMLAYSSSSCVFGSNLNVLCVLLSLRELAPVFFLSHLQSRCFLRHSKVHMLVFAGESDTQFAAHLVAVISGTET
jgi:hypothetical protein